MLIPVYFTVAGQFKMNNATPTAIAAGQCLKLNEDGNLDVFVSVANATDNVVGIAGDTFKLDSPASASGYAADVVINAGGDTTRSQNRISDMYKETLGSGMMTVYSGAGTFRTDQYTGTPDIGDPIYSNANGLITDVSGGGTRVGTCVGSAKAYPSGVPGTDIEGSTSLGTLITFNLLV